MASADRDGSEPVIQISGLDFRYSEGEFRLRIPDLSVGRGESVAVIGLSGSGKTTLLRLIAGILVPQEGRVNVDGHEMNLLDESARRAFRIRRIGLVFDEFELLDYLTVLDNILLPYRLGPVLKLSAEVYQRARSLADLVGIAGNLRRSPRALSQGERQRVAICRAVLTAPMLLLADEPTGNLDPGNKQRVLDILFGYCERNGATLLAVTHEYDTLERFGRVIDFRDLRSMDRAGKVALAGDSARVETDT